MSEQKDLSPDKNISGSGFNINPMDMVMYLINRWYWFVLSVALFGGYAWYQLPTDSVKKNCIHKLPYEFRSSNRKITRPYQWMQFRSTIMKFD